MQRDGASRAEWQQVHSVFKANTQAFHLPIISQQIKLFSSAIRTRYNIISFSHGTISPEFLGARRCLSRRIIRHLLISFPLLKKHLRLILEQKCLCINTMTNLVMHLSIQQCKVFECQF